MSAIFYHNETQKRLAVASKARVEASTRRKVFSELAPFTEFYLAEGYHQKYWLQHVPEVMGELKAMYPLAEDLTASTAAARINGYLGGYGTLSHLRQEVSSFGLSHTTGDALQRIVGGRSKTRV
jgi:peptide-methionine (S)-S-oxide reductase